MEENIFYIEENANRPPPHANNCHGHKTSIANGGLGHWVGDSCGCDGLSTTVPIDFIIYPLLITAFAIIAYIKINNKIK